MKYFSLQHQTLLLSPVTSTTECCFCFGSVSSFFLELFLYWSPVACWAPTDLESSPFSVLSFCLFMLFMGISRQEFWSGLPFPSPVAHILWESSAMTHPTWRPYTAWLRVSWSSTRLLSMWSDWLVFCDCGVHSVCPLMDENNRLMEASWWERLTEGETGYCSDGRGHAQ